MSSKRKRYIIPKDVEILDSLRLLKFNSIYDGNRNIAKQLVKVWRNSKYFTLSRYEGQDEFYDQVMTTFDGFYNKWLDIIAKEIATTELIYLKEFKDSVDLCKIYLQHVRNFIATQMDEGQLSFSDVLFVYQCILYIISDTKNDTIVDYESTDDPLGLEFAYGISYDHDTDSLVKERASIYANYIPIVSNRGIFGLNTYLYLAFNGLYAIGISDDPYPVHGNLFKSDIKETIDHDFRHGRNSLITNSLYPGYVYILSNQDKFEQDAVRGFIFLLFMHIHELGIEYHCNLDNVEKLVNATIYWRTLVDIFPIIYVNIIYGPRALGYETHNVDNEMQKYNGRVPPDILYKAIDDDFGPRLITFATNLYTRLINDYCSIISPLFLSGQSL